MKKLLKYVTSYTFLGTVCLFSGIFYTWQGADATVLYLFGCYFYLADDLRMMRDEITRFGMLTDAEREDIWRHVNAGDKP